MTQPKVKNKAKAHYEYSLSMWNQPHWRSYCWGGREGGREGDLAIMRNMLQSLVIAVRYGEIRTLLPFGQNEDLIFKITSARAGLTVLCHFAHGMINKWRSWCSKSVLCILRPNMKCDEGTCHSGGTDALVLYWCLCVYLSCVSSAKSAISICQVYIFGILWYCELLIRGEGWRQGGWRGSGEY